MDAPDLVSTLVGDPVALAVRERVAEVLDEWGDVEERVSRTQVGYHRRRGFAWVWAPERHLGRPGAAPVVVSFALGRADPSGRIKEVVHPSSLRWVHHVELHDVDEVDDELVAWLREARDHGV